MPNKPTKKIQLFLSSSHSSIIFITSYLLSSNQTLCHISCIITVVLSFDNECFYRSIAKNGSTSLSIPDWIKRYGLFKFLYCLAKLSIVANIVQRVDVHMPCL